MEDEKQPTTLVTPAPPPDAEVEKKEAVIVSIIPPEDLRDASLDEIKLALIDQMEEILHDVAMQIFVNFRTKKTDASA